jgi:hypothetical protein
VEQDPLSPEERELFTDLEETILEELRAQIAVKRLETPDGEEATASLIADVVWCAFDVRRRR